ncbi:MAG: hypothetical protein COY58_00135 [Gammaproteobacteria bacterium CG_4_10_14_0_8_um_filter_38_16]|nr:MAG: hypothetical protein COY58_00135 [Gammaproteobacteria bacterium CG_4_10_14_0_8_um_filter_38_16]PJA02795.1 MAG: hypothetical protein COX72_08380 [Gammaproteobacteria bacterium CG_4_10_14_0_2_um_filter_38_22]PJB10714.1 MAG: hypothetical protein CO120_03335 [Gammaproteobacteria bacterium CG_4_9_14_3_um_filter_38_9]
MNTVKNKSQSRTFLATTALAAFWDKSQPILFLGEWCKPYKNKDSWKNLDYQTLDSPLINQDPNEVLNYIVRVYDMLLPKIAQWLNKIHHCAHSVAYWEIVIGSFLFTHIQIVYDRYERLKVAYSLHPTLTTIGLANTAFMTPLNENEYYLSSMMNDAFNLQIITQIISLSFDSSMRYENYSWENEKKSREKNLNNCRPKLITRLQISLLWFITKLRGKKVVAIIASYGFSKKALYRLMLASRFRILPLPAKTLAKKLSLQLLKTDTDLKLRSSISSLLTQDDFANLVLKLLVFNMPLSFVENYKNECRISKKQYPYFAKVVFGAPTIGHEALKLWVASNRCKGVKQIAWQHGAGYGTLQFYSIEFVEHKFSDAFVTWGMENTKKTIAAPAVSICMQLEENKRRRDFHYEDAPILWVTTEFMRYPFVEIKFAINANQAEKLYYQRQSKLLQLLDPVIFSQIIMRLRYTNWSDNWKYIQDAFPALQLHKPTERSSFYEQIVSAKLLFFDNFNTTHYYGLALNIPTILCWDEKNTGIKDEFKPYFDALRDVGIYHNTVESAADMINKMGNAPHLWWDSEVVQSARKKYCDFFTNASTDWENRWKNMLLGLID